MVISAAPRQIEESLRDNLPAEVRGGLLFETDLDHGLERCEDMVIAMADTELSNAAKDSHGCLLDRVAPDLERHLDEQARFEELLEQLQPWLEPQGFEVGKALAVQGEVQNGLQLLVSGHASVHDAEGSRLYQCGPGDVLESWAAFTQHIASVTTIARTPCRTMTLTPAARRLLQSEDNDLCLRLFAFLLSRQPSSHGLSLKSG